MSQILPFLLAICLLKCDLIHGKDPPPFWMYEIKSAVEAVQKISSVPYSRVCYPDIGCFSTNGPMRHTGRLPMKPEQIKTEFVTFTADKPELSQLLDPHQPSSFGIINRSARLAIIVHGYGMSFKSYGFFNLKNALLKNSRGEVGTVISINWKDGARMGSADRFIQACVNTEFVGRQLAFLLCQLKAHYHFSPSRIYCIGYSLGVPVCSFAGKTTATRYGFQIGRITALDPNWPLFESYPKAQINENDATFVDIIHTSYGSNILAGELGIYERLGHLDFYANNGHNQPQCQTTSRTYLVCDHFSSVEYFIASLEPICYGKFRAYPNLSQKSPSFMGYYADRDVSARGTRYLKTSDHFPYCDVL